MCDIIAKFNFFYFAFEKKNKKNLLSDVWNCYLSDPNLDIDDD